MSIPDKIRQARAEDYARGCRDGMMVTLSLLLGRSTAGGMAYQGEIPPELRLWAEIALAQATQVDIKDAAAEALRSV